MYILSWDCGIKTSSWHYIKVGSYDDFRWCRPNALKVLSCGVIDFLNGRFVEDVPQEEFPGLILEGLRMHGPKVSPSTILLVEIQKPMAGKISNANHATQYCISMYYSDKTHVTKYINAMAKNRAYFGIYTYQFVHRLLIHQAKQRARKGRHVAAVIDDETVRKAHTRINYELFMKIFPEYMPVGIPKKQWRDLADSFMQACAYIMHA